MTPTAAELDAVDASDLPRDTPFLIQYVTETQLSISRYYGGAKFNGRDYTYDPDTDTLVRDDVLKFVGKLRKESRANQDGRKHTT